MHTRRPHLPASALDGVASRNSQHIEEKTLKTLKKPDYDSMTPNIALNSLTWDPCPPEGAGDVVVVDHQEDDAGAPVPEHVAHAQQQVEHGRPQARRHLVKHLSLEQAWGGEGVGKTGVGETRMHE